MLRVPHLDVLHSGDESLACKPAAALANASATEVLNGAPPPLDFILPRDAPFPSCLPALHSSDCESFRCRCGEIVCQDARESHSTLSLALALRFLRRACAACVKQSERH